MVPNTMIGGTELGSQPAETAWISQNRFARAVLIGYAVGEGGHHEHQKTCW